VVHVSLQRRQLRRQLTAQRRDACLVRVQAWEAESGPAAAV
jgi:hypothetical protein